MRFSRVFSTFSLSFPLLLFILLFGPKVLGAAPNTETSTNQCLRDLGGILSCQDRNSLGLPNDIQSCCDGVKQLAVDSCHCNNAIDVTLGEEGRKIYDLEAICRIAQPGKWKDITPFFLKKCDAVKVSHYGCERPDHEIDGERLQAIFNYQKLFDRASEEAVCFNAPAFTQKFGALTTTDVEFTVPYGIGTYKGVQNASEYLGMAFNGLTHAYWVNDTTPDPSKPSRLDISADGETFTLGFTSKGTFYRGLISYQDKYLEQEVKFERCSAKIKEIKLLPTEGMKFLAERFVQTAESSDRYGVKDICRYHTTYCAGDERTKQYESEDACIAYLSTLPAYTPKCGKNRPLSGNSITCKFKHHFMIPANPLLHCAHIGKKGVFDKDQHLKCDDEAECSEDLGQDEWPEVKEIGELTPLEWRRVIEKTNVDHENEPFGCAVPSEESNSSHGQHRH